MEEKIIFFYKNNGIECEVHSKSGRNLSYLSLLLELLQSRGSNAAWWHIDHSKKSNVVVRVHYEVQITRTHVLQ